MGNLILLAALAGLALVVAAALFLSRRPRAEPASPPARGERPAPPGTALPGAPPPASAPPSPSAETEDFAPGYRILRLIARGGMGKVYEAEDLALGRRVAIKRLCPELSLDAKEAELFMREARIVASLRHPNIVEIHGVGQGRGESYLIFEFVSGMTLQEVIRTKGRLDPGVTGRIIRQVGAALAHAHAHKVLHCDLKPSNIMITMDSRVKVMDFGIARQARQTLSRLTPGLVHGTLIYMSPEQHLGLESRQTDVYAMGITVYEMLTGSLPFDGAEMLTLKEAARFLPPTQAVPDLPPAADAFMAKALAAKPEGRFQTADEFCAAFETAFPS